MDRYLRSLEEESISTIRDTCSKVRNPGMLWSMGKDSTVMLHLARKAFLGHCPIKIIHIDTTYKIPEMIAWRDQVASELGLQLIVGTNTEALNDGMHPSRGRLTCCGSLKTDALLQVINEHKVQGLMVGIRGDEEGSRGKERVVSPRQIEGNWIYKGQPPEIWGYYNLHLPANVHVRIHPILRWTELDVWKYIKAEELDVIPLYFAREGKRFRSLGCWPCTANIESSATTIDEIIDELLRTNIAERSGRAQDKEDTYAMQKLRSKGYM